MAGDIVYRWSGQIIEPNDYMAFIGKNPGDDNVYIQKQGLLFNANFVSLPSSSNF